MVYYLLKRKIRKVVKHFLAIINLRTHITHTHTHVARDKFIAQALSPHSLTFNSLTRSVFPHSTAL